MCAVIGQQIALACANVGNRSERNKLNNEGKFANQLWRIKHFSNFTMFGNLSDAFWNLVQQRDLVYNNSNLGVMNFSWNFIHQSFVYFQLSRPVARILLSHFKWDKEKLLERYLPCDECHDHDRY